MGVVYDVLLSNSKPRSCFFLTSTHSPIRASFLPVSVPVQVSEIKSAEIATATVVSGYEKVIYLHH